MNFADPQLAGRVARYPNFDLIKLVAASAVIFSHAFLIAEGDESGEPLQRLLGPHNIAGVFSVHIFFVISGFLVARSLEAAESVPQYLLKRFLRLYPGLICCAVFVALVLGPLFSTTDLAGYFEGRFWLRYIAWTTLLPGAQWAIDTVFFYDDPNQIGEIVNGSLWTIQNELLCCIILGGLALARLARPGPLAIFAVACSALSYAGVGAPGGSLSNFIFVAPGFFLAAAMSFRRSWARHKDRLPLLCVAGLIACALTQTLLWGFPLLVAYPLLKLCTSQAVALPETRRLGDITYGVYLYGWPMEQLVRGVLGDLATWWLVFAGALPLAFICGYLSWHGIEKPALRLARRKRFIEAVVAEARSRPVAAAG